MLYAVAAAIRGHGAGFGDPLLQHLPLDVLAVVHQLISIFRDVEQTWAHRCPVDETCLPFRTYVIRPEQSGPRGVRACPGSRGRAPAGRRWWRSAIAAAFQLVEAGEDQAGVRGCGIDPDGQTAAEGVATFLR